MPVAAEEAVAAGGGCDPCAHFFLVDPLDGTREFLKRNGEFTVNIAEVKDGIAVAGVVYAPARCRLLLRWSGRRFRSERPPRRAYRPARGARRIQVRKPRGRRVGGGGQPQPSRTRQTDEFLKRFPVRQFVSAGSSLKFCLLAAGEADIYVRAGRTMEWDTAAGHAVLKAAGGEVTRWDGSPFLYGKPGFENGAFVARACTA